MLKRILVNFALKILKIEVLDKIQYAPVQGFTTLAFENIQKSADIVLDGDPNNKAQFEQLWHDNKKQILSGALETTKQVIIAEVSDDRVEGYLVSLIDEVKKEVDAGNVLKVAA